MLAAGERQFLTHVAPGQRHGVRIGAIWAMLRDGRDYEIREDPHPLA